MKSQLVEMNGQKMVLEACPKSIPKKGKPPDGWWIDDSLKEVEVGLLFFCSPALARHTINKNKLGDLMPEYFRKFCKVKRQETFVLFKISDPIGIKISRRWKTSASMVYIEASEKK